MNYIKQFRQDNDIKLDEIIKIYDGRGFVSTAVFKKTVNNRVSFRVLDLPNGQSGLILLCLLEGILHIRR
jgi:hypothetical protein